MVLKLAHKTAGGDVIEITGWGTDSDIYQAGDRPSAFVEIRNAGDRTINDASIILKVTRKTPIGAFVLIKDKEYKASALIPGFSLPPGKSRRFEVSPFQIPDTSLAKGTYELKAQIIVDNRTIGTIDKIIKVK